MCAQKICLAGAHTSGSNVVTFDSTSWTEAYFTKMKPTIKKLNILFSRIQDIGRSIKQINMATLEH
jgi:hypothetical protein